jgi:hypothetical protein
MSVTWEAFFVDEARLKGVYGSREEQLIEHVEATDYFQFLLEHGAEELAQNLEYAKKVAPREYEPLKRVGLDPKAALRDIVLGRELRPMEVEFYDSILWCICEVIGVQLRVEYPGTLWEIERTCRELGEESLGPVCHVVHPYLPVPVVRRATVADFSVFDPTMCEALATVIDRHRTSLAKELYPEWIDEWLDALGEREPCHHMIVFGA